MSSPYSASIPSDSVRADAVQEAVEAERLRLAQDLHDDLGGRLIALKMALAPLARDGSPDAVRADRLLDEAIDAMHGALRALRPPELDSGMVNALQRIAADFTSAAVTCRFAPDQVEIDAAPQIALGLLRICREALTNAVRHGRASRIEIRLTQSEIEGRPVILLDIMDDGKGYPAEAPDSASIASRVLALNGFLERRAGRKNGAGCHLHIRIPMTLHGRGNG